MASKGEVKDETSFRYAHAEIRTRVVVICGPTRYRQTTEAPSHRLEVTLLFARSKMLCGVSDTSFKLSHS